MSALNATTREDKLRHLSECAAADISYSDPMVAIRGAEALAGYMLSLFEMNPGGRFVEVSFLSHHERSLAKWDVLDGGGVRVGDGTSYAEYDETGRIVSVAVFFTT